MVILIGFYSDSSIHGVYLLESQEKGNFIINHTFFDEPTVWILNAYRETAELFAMVMNSLKTAGKQVFINNIWIALHALETGSVVIIYDKHFSIIPGLRLWCDL